MELINNTYQDILLAPGYTLMLIQELINRKNPDDSPNIAEFIKCRLSSRYLEPFEGKSECMDKSKKSGFAMMACYCLFIETLQAFREGRDQTERKHNDCVFCHFFTNEAEKPLGVFKNIAADFYKNVRCGILHQGETYNGWKIRREGDLFNAETKTINAKKFGKALKEVLERYVERLKTDDALFDNAKRKIDFIIKHCKSN